MAGSLPPDKSNAPRAAGDRFEDHAAIERLTGELLPALMVKLAATGLGELEVREGSWKVRLRRPADATAFRDRKLERSGRSAGGRDHPHGPAAAGLTPVGPGRDVREVRDGHAGADSRRVVATSPGVGTYQPRTETRSGTTVRAGDRIGAVDVLGVQQEVVAPVDGVLGSSLVEPGDAVEYGQELIVIELVVPSVGEG